jgi:putative intracellular protease/amidase
MKDGPPDQVRRVSGEIDMLRGDLANLVAELDRRRHEMFDLRLQARRHPVLLASVAAGAALLLGAGIAVAVRSRRERQRPVNRAREVRRAMARLVEHPEDVAAKPTIREAIISAVGVAIATTLARRLVDRVVASAPAARPTQPRPAPATISSMR